MHNFNEHLFENNVRKKKEDKIVDYTFFADDRVPMNNILPKIKGMPPAVAHSTHEQRCIKDNMTRAILFVYV
jgi:hypothetical protein